MLHTFSSSLSLFLFIVPVAAELSRSSFPPGFIFGTASSAYQYEGATDEGKGPSIWDTYTHEHSEKIDDHSNGDVANDQYHRYKEDVQLMKDLGMDAYRFSISWSRILPSGKLRGGLNREGINYYNNLINYLIANGMKPFVTLFHWDLPQSLEDEYGGFLSNMIIQDYMDYANVCFEAFGDRVKHWITINEPYTFSAFGYGEGRTAPGRCSVSVGNCSTGNSATEPYIVGHNMLLAHAAAVKLYKDKYQGYQKGVIGISLVTPWFVPYSPSRADQDATQRAIDFNFGWFMDPLTSGEYPLSMRSLVGERLPKFLEEEAKAVNGSFDFIGINYYTSNYAADIDHRKCKGTKLAYTTDPYAYLTGEKNGIPIGRQAASKWLYVYPKGIRDLLVYTKNRYNNPVIYITENGVDELNNVSLPLEEALKDHMRIEYHQKHLSFVEKSIRKGVDLRGYFVWSLLDDFEWYFGYAFRFGIYLVDYKDGLKRYPKESATWFRKFLQKGNLSLDNNDPHTRNKLLHVAC